MDSYYRDSGRSPHDRMRSRDPIRSKEERGSPGYYRDRMRSPIHERGHRRRSRSPGSGGSTGASGLDRYEPRGGSRRDEYASRDRSDRGDDRSSRRMVSPPANIDRYVPGQEPAGSAGITINPVPDPSKLPYQVGFSYYGEWWRFNEKIKEEKERIRTGRRREPDRNKSPRDIAEEREREKTRIQMAYDSYKEELQAKMARHFVAEHKKEQWFKERYDPPTRDEFRAALGEFRRGAYAQWEQDMDAGVFDRFSLEGINKGEQGNAVAQEKEEGEATSSNEVLGVSDLVPVLGADIRDENLYQPTLLIKTIAPHVSRSNLESFCKEHLGDGEGGFKWLSLSDPNPSKRYHRIGWVMLHPAPEVLTTIDRADPRDDDEDMDGIKTSAPVQSTAEKALEAINGKTVKDEARGDFVCHVGVHNPPSNPRKKALWDLFSSPDRIRKDLSLVHRLANKFEEDFGVEFSGIARVQEKVQDLQNAGLLRPIISGRRARKERVVDMDVEDDGELHDDDGEINDEEMYDEDSESEDFITQKKELDLLIEYLRRVFNFCFFCVFESDSVHELTRKCPGGHLRRPASTLTQASREVAIATVTGEPFPVKKKAEPMEEGEAEQSESDKKFRSASSKTEQQLLRAYNWVKTFEDKIMQILEPDSVDMKKLGGRPLEEAMDEEMAKFVKQEDEHKWRCKIPDCNKLFKEEHFWKKHVEKRHTEWYESLQHEFTLINSYAIDPSHIAPSRTDANSNGHFPPSNGQSTAGTPRGFSLHNMSIGGPGSHPASFAMGQGMIPMGMPAGWDGRDGSTGPVRRNGNNRNNNYRAGPYDRRQNGGRWDSNNRNNKSSSGSRWGDGGSGGSTSGPREAVQGRSLKSYEDLDQVGGGAGSELNY
ncbi:Serrate RNA effector molecule -like protein [Ceratocystis fimbriata CBS 114723]|uniref:Serrate RNA effector molecule-like protein n=1 Tax=Ceratocystis fimbriata CBS 114723 TaxID=1035309 RepID=A0A2C5WVM1_9PEZI|nr:Serrate RNA effector molecule -like protein [Ceratocystis fimbriata CBS 114723]